MAIAQVCNDSIYTWPAESGRNDYFVSFHQDAGMGADRYEILGAIKRAASAYNEHGSTGYFMYQGWMFENDLNNLCGYGGDWSLITFDASQCSPWDPDGITVFPKCGGTRWGINVCPTEPWSVVGDPAPGEKDLVSAMMYAFGHTLDMAEPSASVCANEGSVMCSPEDSVGSTRGRDFYDYDLQCMLDVADMRDNFDEVVEYNSFAPAAPWFSMAGGSGFKSQPFYVGGSAAAHGRTYHYEDSGNTMVATTLGAEVNGNIRVFSISHRAHSPFSWWLPWDAGTVRTAYTREHSQLGSGWDRVHGFRVARYAASLTSNVQGWEWLEFRDPTNPNGTGYGRVRSAYQPSFGMNIDLVVAVWADQHRTTTSDNRRINIAAFESISTGRLHIPRFTSYRTAIQPSVACKPVFTQDRFTNLHPNGESCLLTWVDYDDGYGYIRHQAFNPVPRGQTIPPLPNTPTITKASTDDAVATWMALDGRFYRAYIARYSHDVIVESSLDGVEWRFEENLGESIQAPRASSFYMQTQPQSTFLNVTSD